jgi:orotate phosphoribosyltransferase
MVVPQIAELLNKNIVLVRKKDEKRYSDFAIEGVKPFRYIIVDDLICSGDTIRHITRSIKIEYDRSQCVGLYCYMPEECAYSESNLNLFTKEYRMPLLNPYPKRV